MSYNSVFANLVNKCDDFSSQTSTVLPSFNSSVKLIFTICVAPPGTAPFIKFTSPSAYHLHFFVFRSSIDVKQACMRDSNVPPLPPLFLFIQSVMPLLVPFNSDFRKYLKNFVENEPVSEFFPGEISILLSSNRCCGVIGVFFGVAVDFFRYFPFIFIFHFPILFHEHRKCTQQFNYKSESTWSKF